MKPVNDSKHLACLLAGLATLLRHGSTSTADILPMISNDLVCDYGEDSASRPQFWTPGYLQSGLAGGISMSSDTMPSVCPLITMQSCPRMSLETACEALDCLPFLRHVEFPMTVVWCYAYRSLGRSMCDGGDTSARPPLDAIEPA